MTERESMNHPLGLPVRHVTKEEGGNSGAMEKLDSYFSLTEDCMEAVQMMPSRKFNSQQCGYLAEKLKVVAQGARSFLEVLRTECYGPHSSVHIAKWVEIFRLLLALAKQIESFVQGCCKDAWIQAAMTLTNVSEYVSSLGFKLELCRLALCKKLVVTKSLTLVEVGTINQVEVEIVEKKASMDVNSLFRKVTKELNSLYGDNRDLAAYLLQRLLRDEPNPASDDGSFLNKLFNWVIPAEQLGRGTSATVHKAMWLGTPVAKKTFDGSENPDFLKEVKILSQLCHSNITSMFCCAMNKWRSSIIMELMDGDLYTLMERRLEENLLSPPFPILEAVDIMLQVGEGVNYLHNNGIVHRDLKSKNILVKLVKPSKSELETGYVHVKVADFGISKANMRSTTYSNQTYNVGTCRWMPPEIINLVARSQESSSRNDGKPKHPFKCDTYSFALVCYEILTGCTPFSSIHSSNEIKRMVMKGVRPDLPNDCPPRLIALIMKCWNQDPKERPTFDDICLELKYLKYLLMQDAGSDRSRNDSALGGMDINSNLQMTQALQMQMEVQKRVYEQLEIERKLRLGIETQGQCLKIMPEDASFMLLPHPRAIELNPASAASEPAHSRDGPTQSSQGPEASFHPPSTTGQYQSKQGSPPPHIAALWQHSMRYGLPTYGGSLQESTSPSFQMPTSYHNVFLPPSSTSISQWMNSPSPQSGLHWASGDGGGDGSGGMSIGVSSRNSGGSRQASHAQRSALVPPSSSGMNFYHPPRGGPGGGEGGGFFVVPHSNGGMESGVQMPFQEMNFGRGGGGSTAPYPSATMVITPKTDGAGALNLCDLESKRKRRKVLLKGSSIQEVNFGRGGGEYAAPYPSVKMAVTPKTDGASAFNLCDTLEEWNAFIGFKCEDSSQLNNPEWPSDVDKEFSRNLNRKWTPGQH